MAPCEWKRNPATHSADEQAAFWTAQSYATIPSCSYGTKPSIKRRTSLTTQEYCWISGGLELVHLHARANGSPTVLRSHVHTHIEVHSDTPVDASLGSSAAFSVSATATFLIRPGCLSTEGDSTLDR
ncbi:hypothetical protein PHET_09676 [Paragonimus heterotremus]|uniref:Uncharacterized protein n=1 Tax=Paragonimus heterotremus TaxID=100268 RepID=A0A8J4T327_9TREM|nr:hypothetical protein PHET_09676 [Paragonimus heterotremus]